MNWYKRAQLDDLAYVIYALLVKVGTEPLYHVDDVTYRFQGQDPQKLEQALIQAQGMMGFGQGVSPTESQSIVIDQIKRIASGVDPNLQQQEMQMKNQTGEMQNDSSEPGIDPIGDSMQGQSNPSR